MEGIAVCARYEGYEVLMEADAQFTYCWQSKIDFGQHNLGLTQSTHEILLLYELKILLYIINLD
jgi:hypothetical protein